jgi:predicted peroxiredoxin
MEDQKKICIVITSGMTDERSSVAWSMANGAITAGLDVSVFLASAGIDWVRKGAADKVCLNPLDPPMKEMIDKVVNSGCHIGVCPPCTTVRGYDQADLIDGIEIVGASAIWKRVKEGAVILSY